MPKKILLLAALFVVPSIAAAETAISCDSDDAARMSVLRKALEAKGIKYRMETSTDGEAICVSRQDQTEFMATKNKLFPPEEASAPAAKILSSPNGIPVSSTKPSSRAHQQALEAELQKHKIWFAKDETGVLWYEWTSEKDVQEIDQRIRERLATPIPADRSLGFKTKADADVFTNLLSKKGIRACHQLIPFVILLFSPTASKHSGRWPDDTDCETTSGNESRIYCRTKKATSG
ncbi:MAG: hypothetical protein HY308_01855 [Gammaproteobacteria bacterium]|nr:hypothetical protein [Gammaproteobacteria bacterium]